MTTYCPNKRGLPMSTNTDSASFGLESIKCPTQEFRRAKHDLQNCFTAETQEVLIKMAKHRYFALGITL